MYGTVRLCPARRCRSVGVRPLADSEQYTGTYLSAGSKLNMQTVTLCGPWQRHGIALTGHLILRVLGVLHRVLGVPHRVPGADNMVPPLFRRVLNLFLALVCPHSNNKFRGGGGGVQGHHLEMLGLGFRLFGAPG